ncbi:MAG: hypothetical protein R3E96_03465 [Planctomycetota bacterium]
MFGAMLAAGMVSVMFATAGTSSRQEDLRQDSVQARYLAEGGAEIVRRDLAQSIANWDAPPTTGTVYVADRPVTYRVERVAPTRTVTDKSGIQTLVDTYEVLAMAEVDRRRAQVHHMIQTQATPVFQFAVFYNGDLEVLPGPDMTLGGRVHTNGDMYLGCDGTLTMDTNYVHAVGNMYRQRKDTGDASTGDVRIRQWVEDPYDSSEPNVFQSMLSLDQMLALGMSTDSGYDSLFTSGFDADGDGRLDGPDDWLPFAAGSLSRWGEPEGYATSGHTVLTGQHDLLEASAPNIGSIAMFEESASGDYAWNSAQGRYDFVGAGLGTHHPGYFHENAGLSILVSADGSEFQVFGPGGATSDSNGISYKDLVIASGAVSIDGVADMRQSNSSNTPVRVVEVDLELLGDAGLFPENGLLYAAHYGMGKARMPRLAAEERGGTRQRIDRGLRRFGLLARRLQHRREEGASIIGDSVNLLSNGWDGSKTAGSLPEATETTTARSSRATTPVSRGATTAGSRTCRASTRTGMGCPAT